MFLERDKCSINTIIEKEKHRNRETEKQGNGKQGNKETENQIKREREKQRNRETKKQKIIYQLNGLYNKKLLINTVKKRQSKIKTDRKIKQGRYIHR